MGRVDSFGFYHSVLTSMDRARTGQVPCYTEGEDSLRKTIDSLATLNYDDKRKLLMIICDGMIIGSGNDKATPRIVLDILGVDQDVDPDPLMFKSVAEGSKQLNYGKVWSGLYEVEGRECRTPLRLAPQAHFADKLYPQTLCLVSHARARLAYCRVTH